MIHAVINWRRTVTVSSVVILGLGGLLGFAVLSTARLQKPTEAQEQKPVPEVPDPQAFLSALPTGRPGQAPMDADIVVARLSTRLKAAPKDPALWSLLGDGLMQKARETADVSYYAHAERAYQASLALSPDYSEGLVGMAWVTGGRHEFEESIKWAQRASALRPEDPNPHGLLGDAKMELGDYDGAGIHYQAMLDIRPDQGSYHRAAHWLFVTGDTRKALWLIRKAVETGGRYTENTAWCIAQEARMHFETGALLPAEQQIANALKKAPNNHHLLAMSGRLKAARGEHSAAIEAYEKAVAVAPQHETLVALAELHQLKNQPKKVAEYEAQVEAIHKLNRSNGVQGDSQLARFWADRDRNLPEALALVQQEYKTRKNITVADTLAWCLLKNGNAKQADIVMRSVLKRKTPDALMLFHAGMIQAALGRQSESARLLYQALSLNPHFHPVFAQVASKKLAEVSQATSPQS